MLNESGHRTGQPQEVRDDDVAALFDAARPQRLGNRWIADPGDRSAAALFTEAQWALLALAITLPALALVLDVSGAFRAICNGAAVVFLTNAAWRVFLVLAGREPAAPIPLPDHRLPTYTVICPLFREAGMVDALLRALEAIDYPRDRLQVLLALEGDDAETVAAVHARALPSWVRSVLTPAGVPRTKPRACNVALALATGELLVVYDAEDRPHPGQLREAAARFAAARDDLVCLQAPLRIRPRRRFLQRQFAMEYAAQFEVALHAFARLGLPFPLGGTSNHFRTASLRELGGWDPWNVTEDADLGFRIADRGWRTGTLALHTLETSPETFRVWLHQRTRWLKGYMQTLAVWTRRAPSLKTGTALALTLGMGLGSALLHGAAAVYIGVQLLWALTVWRVEQWPSLDLSVLGCGVIAAWLMMTTGARRAGFRPHTEDYLGALLYWPLLTVAAWRAGWQLLRDPFLWEKTPHTPPTEPPDWTEGGAAD